MLVALLQGLLGASSLALGALLGIFWQPGRTFSAAIMAFGSGTLLSAIASTTSHLQRRPAIASTNKPPSEIPGDRLHQ